MRRERNRFAGGRLLAGILFGVVLGVVVSFLIIGSVWISSSGSTEEAESEEVLDEELTEKISDIVDHIDRYYLYEKDTQAMQDGILSGLVNSLDDDYAYYYNEEEYAALLESNSGVYCGIGVQVTQDVETGVITVTKVFAGSPALEAGVQPGDILTSVDGEDIAGLDLDTVVTYIKGDEGTTVDLTFVRDSEVCSFTVERRFIDIPSVEYTMMEDQIGYLMLTEFSESTYDQYMQAIGALQEEGMQGLIVDVRDNPGGLLNSVVEILDEMLPEGPIVTVREATGEEDIYYSDADQAVSLPMIVLVNGNSASAAEIYTAALQDYGIATIVGTTTFGKGIVQTIYTLSDQKTGFKMTTAEYYTPNDVCIHGTGIEPDVVVEPDEILLTSAQVETEDDNQLQEALRLMQEMIGTE